ncbi:MAG: hypothetical protein FJ245_11920 [Nitrospira sp.]|nr:hypothetical protein [Nitrospira sp.]
MRVWQIAILSAVLVQLTACGGGSWVHPNKPQEQFTADYNKCEGDVLKDPKLQQGNRYMVLQATERCVMKKGWMLRDTEN